MKNILTFFLVFCCIDIIAQTESIRFTRVSIADGLSLSSVYTGIQDNKGFLWFGTEDGLNRYDGENFTIFRPQNNDTNSLTNKWIDGILEDSHAQLWFFSKEGVNLYDPVKEKFTRYLEYLRPVNNNSLTCFYEDQHANIYVGTQNGAYIFNRKTNAFEYLNYNFLLDKTINSFLQVTDNEIFIATNDGLFSLNLVQNIISKISLNNQNIYSLYKDKYNNVWIGTEGELYKYDAKKNIVSYKLNNNELIETIFCCSHSRYWIGTSGGFYRFTEKDATFEKIIEAPEASVSLSINNRKPIFEDNQNNIWFGTYGRGVFKLSHGSNELINFQHEPTNEHSLSENNINLIFQDKSNCIWFGTFGAGLNKYDPYGTKFQLIKNHPYNENSLSSDFVWAIYEDADGEIWIGTNADGVNRYNPATEKFKVYKNITNNANSLSNNCVRKIYQDQDGYLWFGTNGGGLNKFDKKTEKFKIYKHIEGDTNSLSNNSVRVIYQDDKKNFYLGTANGFNLFREDTQKFKAFYNDPSDSLSISGNFIYAAIYENNDGKILIGTYMSGLTIFNPTTQTFENYKRDENDITAISSDKIYSIAKDPNNFFWIGTNEGLEKFDYQKKIFYHYKVEDGLPNNTIYGIILDKNSLWLSTNYGVSCYNLENNSFKNFDINDGLQSNEFNGGAFHHGKSGRIYFGGVYGVNFFYPDSIKYNMSAPEVVITNFSIFNSNVEILKDLPDFIKIGNEVGQFQEKYYIAKSISYTDTIILSFREKVFSFEFSALHFSNPEKNKYKYRLQNFEEKWNYSDNRNYVTYTNIDAGTYVFEITAANSDGIWSDHVTRLTIIITPPFWETIGFRVTALIIFFATIFYFYRRRINIIKRQKERLEIIVKERTNEILQKNNILEQQKNQIEKAHKNITDSILYAQRIQTAVLPDEKMLMQVFDNYFIFFKPRDIVSGDFYFVKKVKNTIYLAAADSTGHGVPGAFMSMLGVALLNEIIKNHQLNSASQILNELREHIKNSLQQTGERGEQQDGMDIAFCIINSDTQEMKFAGAHNHCWIVRQNTNENTRIHKELIVLEADKQPVGIFLKERPFSEHNIFLLNGDVFYIFSDGLHSQFGGENNEKYKTRRFKDFLISISEQDINDQKIMLEKEFQTWKGEYEQTDDILVIGVKVCKIN